MPNLPDKKNRPWIPRRKKKVDILNYNRSRSSGEMLKFYQSKQWRSLRNYKIQINPLCEICERKGLVEGAREIDHIIAIKDGGERLGLSNLQSLCKSCHGSKSAKEREARKHTKKFY
jgi:5-methylcytosine-specific restriction protein A